MLPPLRAPCPHHADALAVVACCRCGTLVCGRCGAESPPDEPVCSVCTAAHGLEATLRANASLDPGGCVERGFQVFRQHWGILVAAALILIAAELAPAIPVALVEASMRTVRARPPLFAALVVLDVVIRLISLYVNSSLVLGMVALWLRLVRRQPAELAHLFVGFRSGLGATAANLLYLAAVILGLVCFIVPGIVLLVGLGFWSELMVDKGLGPIAALRASFRVTRGFRLSLLVLGLLSVGIAIAGLLACCVGVIPAFALAIGVKVVGYTSLVYPGNRYLRR